MDKNLVKKRVVNEFIGITNELTENEIEDLQDLLSFRLHKLIDNGERFSFDEVKNKLKLTK